MLIAVRAEVESVEHWRDKFKTHGDLFKSQGVSVAYMGSSEENKVIAVFETCLLYTSPSPRDRQKSRMPSSA